MSIEIVQSNKFSQRATIGLLIDSTIQGYEQSIWQSVVEQAKMSDVNLVTFNVASQNIDGASREFSQTIELINENNIQGLIITSATILDIISINTIQEFFNRFQPLPMLSIGVVVEGIPSLVVDNYSGMRSVIDHLIENHGYQRIAFLKMFGDNPETEERYRAYTESLADHNIPLDPDLIVTGDYFGLQEEAVSLLLDQRNSDFDAFVAVNDDMATSVMQVLQARGYCIPDDIAIAGFDDHDISQFLTPPLTTVRQPFSDMGKFAVELLINQLNGEEVPAKVNLSTELVVRQSCGCLHPDVANAFISESFQGKITDIPELVSSKDEIITEILKAAKSNNQYKPIICDVFDAFIQTLNSQSPDRFIKELTIKSEELSNSRSSDFNWHSAITILRRYTLLAISDQKTLSLAENLFQQARTLIANQSQRAQANQRFQTIKQANLYRIFSQRLTTLTDQESLMRMLQRQLPQLEIPSCYLVINERLQPNSGQKQLLLAYNTENQFPLPGQGLLLKHGDFPSAIFFPSNRQYSFIAENLIFQNQDCGFILFEASSTDGSLYRSLADQISSALENVVFVEHVEDRAVKLLTAAEVSQAANSILEQAELIRKSVELIKERFNLYYAGLFLIDESRQWAELRAGTGKSGANMIAEGWRLEAGGSSMVGRCITTGKADIQLDVDRAPVHLRNPHLPNTKSELALPLISRGGILGALTIQSESGNAFSDEDITVLQTMADQIATSIANAQLFEQTQTALMDTETLLSVSRFGSTFAEFDVYIQNVLALTLKATGIEEGLFSIINPQTNLLEISAHHIPESFLASLQMNGLEGTLCDLVFQQRTSIIVHNLEEYSPIDAEGLINLGFKSYQGVPLETKGEIYGTLCTFSKTILQHGDTRTDLLQAIGQQVAIAIENARLIEQTTEALAFTEQQSQRLAALNDLSDRLSQSETLESIYQAGSSVVSHIIASDHISFARLLENNQQAELMAVTEKDGLVPLGTLVPIERGPIGDAITSKRPILVEDIVNTYPDFVNILPSLGLKSLLVVPLIVGEIGIGAFYFGCKIANGFSERDRDLAAQFASAMGYAIDNFNLLQQTQRTLADLEATQKRYQLQAWSDYNQDRTSNGYRQIHNAFEPIGKQKISEAEQAIQKQTPVVSEDGDNHNLTIPIMLRDQPIGAFGLQADQSKRRWTAEEISLAQEISEQFALAVESLRLLDETQRRAARERLVGEITTKLRASSDPQAMIQTAANELRNALKAKRTQVLFRQDETPHVRGEE